MTMEPNQMQTLDPFAVQVATRMEAQDARFMEIMARLEQLTSHVSSLSETLASHVRANIETMQEVRDHIGQQMAYRLFREDVEENKLRMEIAQKNLEISFLEKRINNLTEENSEVDDLRLNYEKQKLELENLRTMQTLLKTTKSTTQDKLKAMAPKTLGERARETAVLAAVGTLTTAGVTSVLAFIYFLIRLYMAAN